MLILRSIIFQASLYVNTLVQMIFWLPSFFVMRREDGWKVVKLWALSNLWLHHVIVGTRFEFRGLENIPLEDGLIVASKHQSAWETYVQLLFLRDPSYILKRELMFIPLFGWFAAKMNVIAVNRGKRSEALRAMNRDAKAQVADRRQIIIYPEGTRKPAFGEPAYKYGVTHMYTNIGVKVLPVAINAGLFWPRKGWKLHQGTVLMEYLPVIMPGLDADEFSEKLQNSIESKTAELMDEPFNDSEFTGKKQFSRHRELAHNRESTASRP